MTSESGLAELLLDPEMTSMAKPIAETCIIDVIGEPAEIAKNWAARVEGILADPPGAFQRAKELRNALVPVLSWRRAAQTFSNHIQSF
jgi:hypothetical protein